MFNVSNNPVFTFQYILIVVCINSAKGHVSKMCRKGGSKNSHVTRGPVNEGKYQIKGRPAGTLIGPSQKRACHNGPKDSNLCSPT